MSELSNDQPPAAGSDMHRTRFDVHVDRHRVANVSGELDASTAPRFAVELDRLADDGGTVCVDCSNLEFCDAAGINVLVATVHRLGTRGRLVIYDPSPMVARIIGITGLDQLVDVTVSRVINAPPAAITNGTGEGPAHRTVTTGAVVSIPCGATAANPDRARASTGAG
jgi:anti-anti-sigma factor